MHIQQQHREPAHRTTTAKDTDRDRAWTFREER
jgi:hypothetical protein